MKRPKIVLASVALLDRLAHAQHGGVDGKSPPGTDDDPAPTVSFGAVEHYVGHDTVAEEYQDGRAQQLREIDVHGGSGLISLRDE